MAVINLLSAFAALELVIVNIGGTYTNGGLEVPVLGQNPLIAVADTAAGIPSLKAMVFQLVPETEGHLDVGRVVLASEGVNANERTVEAMAEPIAPLRINYPVL